MKLVQLNCMQCSSESGGMLCLLALVILIVQRAIVSPKELWVLLVMVGLAFLVEAVYRRITGRTIKPVRRIFTAPAHAGNKRMLNSESPKMARLALAMSAIKGAWSA